MPDWQRPVQQFALPVHSAPAELHGAQMPLAHTPLQHWLSFWQFPVAAVHAHEPLLHVPAQHCCEVQLMPCSAQNGPPEPPPVALPPPV